VPQSLRAVIAARGLTLNAFFIPHSPLVVLRGHV
jgi:hypothetical protein